MYESMKSHSLYSVSSRLISLWFLSPALPNNTSHSVLALCHCQNSLTSLSWTQFGGKGKGDPLVSLRSHLTGLSTNVLSSRSWCWAVWKGREGLHWSGSGNSPQCPVFPRHKSAEGVSFSQSNLFHFSLIHSLILCKAISLMEGKKTGLRRKKAMKPLEIENLLLCK